MPKVMDVPAFSAPGGKTPRWGVLRRPWQRHTMPDIKKAARQKRARPIWYAAGKRQATDRDVLTAGSGAPTGARRSAETEKGAET